MVSGYPAILVVRVLEAGEIQSFHAYHGVSWEACICYIGRSTVELLRLVTVVEFVSYRTIVIQHNRTESIKNKRIFPIIELHGSVVLKLYGCETLCIVRVRYAGGWIGIVLVNFEAINVIVVHGSCITVKHIETFCREVGKVLVGSMCKVLGILGDIDEG